jgi:hypothetical protein
VGAQLRPVEATSAGDEHEDVVVLTPPHHQRSQQRVERNALQLRALLGAAGWLRPEDAVLDPGRLNGGDSRGQSATSIRIRLLIRPFDS